MPNSTGHVRAGNLTCALYSVGDRSVACTPTPRALRPPAHEDQQADTGERQELSPAAAAEVVDPPGAHLQERQHEGEVEVQPDDEDPRGHAGARKLHTMTNERPKERPTSRDLTGGLSVVNGTSTDQDAKSTGTVPGGFGILYATRNSGSGRESVSDHDLPNHLRERYWVDRIDHRIRERSKRLLSVGFGLHYDIGRSGVERKRHEPGDAFLYSIRGDHSRTRGDADWIEVTERFLTVHPRDVNDFMRHHNGLPPTNREFDPDAFLHTVNPGRPSRTAQRAGADEVIEAIEAKLTRPSYKPMLESYGYGVLVVGLPLWFATLPTDPLRPENAIDDFATRTAAGLALLGRKYLRDKACSFGQVIVLWEPTQRAQTEWLSRARFDVYEDPRYLKMRNPISGSKLARALIEAGRRYENANPGRFMPGHTLRVSHRERSKEGRFANLPPLAEELERYVVKGRREEKANVFARAVFGLKLRLLELLCFLKIHGIVGFERWAAGKLPPALLALWAMRRRTHRFYRESIRRQNNQRHRAR